MIYIAIFLVLVVCMLLEINLKFDKKSRLFNMIIILLIVLIGTRQGNGADFYRYEGLFNVMSSDIVLKYDDIGFSFLVYLLKSIGLDSRGIFLFFAMLLCILLRKGILDSMNYKYPALLLFYSLYMFPFGFNAMSQGLATAIMIYSIKFMKQKMNGRVLVLTILAISFHGIGLLNVLVWIVMNWKITNKTMVLLTISGIMGSVLIFYLSHLGVLEKILTGEIERIYVSYFAQYEAGVDLISFLARIVMLIIISIGIGMYNDYEKKLYFIYLVGLMAYIALLSNSLLATRINLSIKIVEILLIGSAIKGIKGRTGKIIYVSLITVFLLVVLLGAMGNAELNPYQSWLF